MWIRVGLGLGLGLRLGLGLGPAGFSAWAPITNGSVKAIAETGVTSVTTRTDSAAEPILTM